MGNDLPSIDKDLPPWGYFTKRQGIFLYTFVTVCFLLLGVAIIYMGIVAEKEYRSYSETPPDVVAAYFIECNKDDTLFADVVIEEEEVIHLTMGHETYTVSRMSGKGLRVISQSYESLILPKDDCEVYSNKSGYPLWYPKKSTDG